MEINLILYNWYDHNTIGNTKIPKVIKMTFYNIIPGS